MAHDPDFHRGGLVVDQVDDAIGTDANSLRVARANSTRYSLCVTTRAAGALEPAAY